jgi:hypothetical protein
MVDVFNEADSQYAPRSRRTGSIFNTSTANMQGAQHGAEMMTMNTTIDEDCKSDGGTRYVKDLGRETGFTRHWHPREKQGSGSKPNAKVSPSVRVPPVTVPHNNNRNKRNAKEPNSPPRTPSAGSTSIVSTGM